MRKENSLFKMYLASDPVSNLLSLLFECENILFLYFLLSECVCVCVCGYEEHREMQVFWGGGGGGVGRRLAVTRNVLIIWQLHLLLRGQEWQLHNAWSCSPAPTRQAFLSGQRAECIKTSHVCGVLIQQQPMTQTVGAASQVPVQWERPRHVTDRLPSYLGGVNERNRQSSNIF